MHRFVAEIAIPSAAHDEKTPPQKFRSHACGVRVDSFALRRREVLRTLAQLVHNLIIQNNFSSDYRKSEMKYFFCSKLIIKYDLSFFVYDKNNGTLSRWRADAER
ncbi:hypothetical protein HMPREF7215_2308 [Pyramidobacter piscolens W5455]|uniref:Uncharacterized protein n=1 Tax=Pyramidobacter piscolens W5455 TaxID=352165 RepID=A0ABM9ZXK7_9BACT|nr:hypothetical protein HMPREF7215_2308 [Pyramidobacter piscolens W5455]